MAGFSDDIEQLEEVLRVYRQLGAEREPRLADLVSPFRKLLRIEEVQMKRQPFSANARTPARLFLFNDMALLAEELPSDDDDDKQTGMLGRLFGSFSHAAGRLSVRRNSPAPAAGPARRAARRSQMSRGSTRSFSTTSSADSSLQLEEVLELHRCSVERVSSPEGEAGFRITHVFRVRDSNGRPATRIDKIEIWCDSLDQADALYGDTAGAIDALLEQQDREAAAAAAADGALSDTGSVVSDPADGRPSIVSTASGETGGSGGGRRKWATQKSKMHRRRNGTLRSTGAGSEPDTDDESQRPRSDSHSSGGLSGSHHGSDRLGGGLTLADLESRYGTGKAKSSSSSKGGKASSDSSSDEASFSVIFGEGPMGFSLSSTASLGVIIGRLAEGGMAAQGGVEVGDRLTHVGKSEISHGTQWRDAVAQIKALPRPVELTFLRNFSVNTAVADAEKAQRASKQRASKERGGATAGSSLRARRAASKTSLTSGSTTGGGRRKWAERRAREGAQGARLTSLEDLANMYRASAAATAEEAGEAAKGDGGSVTSSSSAARRLRTAQEERERELEDVADMFDELTESTSENERACAATLREMFDTERSYVRDLGLIVGDYLLPLRRTVRRIKCSAVAHGSTFCEHRNVRSKCSKLSTDSRPIMEAEDIKAVFLNVETLVKVNSELLNVLRSGLAAVARERGTVPASVTDLVRVFAPAFVRIMPFFRIYSLYCHAYTRAIDKLLVARARNRHLDDFIKDREKKSKTSLQHLLIKPVQRICKYPLLFKSLLKAIVPYVGERIEQGADVEALDALSEDLERAMDVVDRIAKNLNEKMGEQESLERMMDVYTELGGEVAVPDLISPSRRFIDRTDALVRSAPFDASTPLRHELLYLFNDTLILARSANNAGYGTLRSTATGSLRKLPSASKLTRAGSVRRAGAALTTGGAASSNKGSLTKGLGLSFRGKNTADRKKSAASSAESSVGASTLSRASRSHSVSSQTSSGTGRGSARQRAAAAAITLRVDLRLRCSIKPIAEPDETDCFGMSLSYVTRVKEQEDNNKENGSASRRRGSGKSTKSDGTAATAGTAGPVRTRTQIDKVQLWFPTEEKRDQMVRLLTSQIENLQQLDEMTKEASAAVGAKVRERTWKQKQRLKSRTASRVSQLAQDQA